MHGFSPYISDHALASSKNACDITLKHALLAKSSLWQNPALKSHQISFRFFGYQNFAQTVVILNVSVLPLKIATLQPMLFQITQASDLS